MLQTTVQDYRDIFLDDHLPLTLIKVHRSVTQTFMDKADEFQLNLTTRNIFDYLMHNAHASHKSLHTFGETSPIEINSIAERLQKKVKTVYNEITKLVKADLVERHPVKRNVFIIPSMIQAKSDMAEQALMKRKINLTKAAETRITELEADMERPLTDTEKKRVYAEAVQPSQNGNGNGNRNGHKHVEYPF